MEITTNRMNFWRYQAPAIVFAIMIFIVSSIPRVPLPDLAIGFEDKIGHVMAYTLLGFLLGRAMYFQYQVLVWQRNFYLLSIVLGSVYGVLDEFHQHFVPGRTADIYDTLADVVGVLIGATLFRMFINRK